MADDTEETKDEGSEGPKSAEREAVAGNQQPITITLDPDVAPLTQLPLVGKLQPLVGLDGGDGTRASRATKVADNVWTPFHAQSETTTFVPAAATTTNNTGDDTAFIASGLANI